MNDLNSLLSLNDPVINERINSLVDSQNHIKIGEWALFDTDHSGCATDKKNASNRGESTGSEISYAREYGIMENGISDWPQATLMHELQHAYDYDKGRMAGEVGIPPSATDPAEIRAVQMENRVRNNVNPGHLRTTYNYEEIDFPKGKKIADK